jgi:hypothetical protein
MPKLPMTTKPVLPTPPTLRELVWKAFARDQAQFLAAYPWPVLLIALPGTPGGGAESTAKIQLGATGVFTERAPAGFNTYLEEDESPETSSLAKKGRESIRSGDASVCPLAKSGRNSFGNMVTLGRAPNNDIVIAANTVSKLHGYFMQAPDGRWRFCDAGSLNGVWIRGTRMQPRTSADLADDDEILLGPDVPMLFKTPQGLFERVQKLAP